MATIVKTLPCIRKAFLSKEGHPASFKAFRTHCLDASLQRRNGAAQYSSTDSSCFEIGSRCSFPHRQLASQNPQCLCKGHSFSTVRTYAALNLV